jgi:hypothetical protein
MWGDTVDKQKHKNQKPQQLGWNNENKYYNKTDNEMMWCYGDPKWCFYLYWCEWSIGIAIILWEDMKWHQTACVLSNEQLDVTIGCWINGTYTSCGYFVSLQLPVKVNVDEWKNNACVETTCVDQWRDSMVSKMMAKCDSRMIKHCNVMFDVDFRLTSTSGCYW